MCKEICICAAIKLPRGLIIRGQRHVDCIRSAGRMRINQVEVGDSEQGFITSKNRFVDRKEGCRLQKEAGIVSKDKKHPYFNDELYSEDLY